ncbi:MAG TPA: molybdopterin converting factor subunit 1 [Thermoanaerobaculia bacterium]|nr:molybdopterin converting factor subunit 1 [Thermoanaerobaculia bacterium]
MQIRLLCFAVLEEIAGTREQRLEVATGTTPQDLWAMMRGKHPRLSSYVTPPLVAVNQEYAPPTTRLEDGDEVAFIPPVSGG